MKIFNRIVVILDILLTMTAASLVLILPIESLSLIQDTSTNLLHLVRQIQPNYQALFQAVLIVGAMLIDAALVALLVAEFRRPRSRAIRVSGVSGGEIQVTTESIINRLRYHIDSLPQVLAIKPRVWRKRDGVALAIEVETSADVNVPRKAEEILDITRQVIQDKLGLKLAAKPHIQIHMIPHPPGAPHPITPPSLPTASSASPAPELERVDH